MKTDRRIRHSPGRGRLRTNPRRGQAGYALLMAMFMVVLMIISADVVLQNLATEGRRQREAETIWRGRQYMRAIRLYYQKTGHYPQTLEDLQKGLPELHFLRLVAYRDPMNRPDGEWRMIYVNPAGQIIGSVRYATLQQMALMDLNGGQIPAGAVLPNFSVSAGALGAPATGGQSLGATQTGVGTSLQGSQSATSDSSSGAAQSSSSSQSAALGQAAAALAQLKPTGPVDGPVIGGLLTGVGSKVDAASVKVYRGGKKYIEWEFIWNPLEDQARALQQGLTPQTPQTGQPGQPIGPAGIGASPSSGPSGTAGTPAVPTAPAQTSP